jgi:hypothetical protein
MLLGPQIDGEIYKKSPQNELKILRFEIITGSTNTSGGPLV